MAFVYHRHPRSSLVIPALRPAEAPKGEGGKAGIQIPKLSGFSFS